MLVTEIAFKFLAPNDAPVPPRPAARRPAVIGLAIRTNDSPAGPIENTSSASIAFSHCQVVMPRIDSASCSETSMSSISNLTIESLRP